MPVVVVFSVLSLFCLLGGVTTRGKGRVSGCTKCQTPLTCFIRVPGCIWQATGVGALLKEYKNGNAKHPLVALWQESSWLFWPRGLIWASNIKMAKPTRFPLNEMLVSITIKLKHQRISWWKCPWMRGFVLLVTTAFISLKGTDNISHAWL